MTFIKSVRYLGAILLLLVSAPACKNTLDINDNPNFSTSAVPSFTLPVAQVAMANAVGLNQNGASHAASTFMMQVVSGFDALYNNYNIAAGSGSSANTWNSLYTTCFSNLNSIIASQQSLNTPSSNFYLGVSKLMKAYSSSVLVDLFGKIPYSEAGLGAANTKPAYEDGAVVYPKIFASIDDAISNLNKVTASISNSGDLIYSGDPSKWIKFGNSLKLKLYNQLSAKPAVIPGFNSESAIGSLLGSNAPLIDASSEFELVYNKSLAPDNRHPAYTDDYAGGQKVYEIAPYFYHILADKPYSYNKVFSGIGVDPRLPYYFYNQLAATDPVPAPIPDYRDGAFVSTWFGTRSQQALGDVSSSQTVLGLYPVGGFYDDGGAKPTPANKPTYGNGGAAPQQMLSYHAVLFIKAEYYLRTNNAGAARSAFSDAIDAAFAKVNGIAAKAINSGATSGTAVPLISSSNITSYRNKVLAKYDAAAPQSGGSPVFLSKLDILLTQKWIATFGYSVDQYNDWRRTGFPKVYSPTDDPFNDPVNGASYDPATKTYNPAKRINRLTYPTPPTVWPYPLATEALLNSNANQNRLIYSEKIFWMP